MTGVEIAMVAVSVVAAGAAAYMQSQALQAQGDAAKAAGDYNNQIMQNNAKSAVDAAGVNEQNASYRAKLLLSTQKASAGASGVDPLEGSPLSLRDETTQQSTLDALKIRYGGATQSAAYVNQGQLDLMEGASAQRVAGAQSDAALVGGAASIARIGSSYAGGSRYNSVDPSLAAG